MITSLTGAWALIAAAISGFIIIIFIFHNDLGKECFISKITGIMSCVILTIICLSIAEEGFNSFISFL